MKEKAKRGRNLKYLLQDGDRGYDKSSFPKGLRKFGRLLRLRNILAAIATLCGLALSVAIIGAAALWLYGKAVTSDFFTTRHIDVAGNVRLSREMVLQYGGLSEGDNSLAISIGDVERNLRETPWVEQATVKRLLPDRFVIKLKERMPSFWVRKDGK
ncbi:MAG: FtsQ-type POTRA domain-containing protein, partial [Desulfovibrio sp.]|nr:FtsQ-type POTRA domain-containing protein [Desulfovibrio sp.]